jgi:hypothetical protein
VSMATVLIGIAEDAGLPVRARPVAVGFNHSQPTGGGEGSGRLSSGISCRWRPRRQ